MNILKSVLVLISVLLAVVAAAEAMNTSSDRSNMSKQTTRSPHSFLESLVGSWQGTCKTWFQPGVLADESPVTGRFETVLGGRFLRHTYEGQLQGKARTGEETIAFNSVEKKFQTSWVDDFHMNYGIMFSEGGPTETGFIVVGSYAVGADQPEWGWKTVYEMTDNDHLIITAYNITPDGTEAKAVETKYVRK